ncbi:MAG: DUF3800 domain-containing protein [Methanomassiliicoccaceae archaeon]|nr:DUF3800 domain-containing protein [Methanomassiliicoccaceae archaeon]
MKKTNDATCPEEASITAFSIICVVSSEFFSRDTEREDSIRQDEKETDARNRPGDESGKSTPYKRCKCNCDKLILVDESGDMGFGESSPDFLILAATILCESDADEWRNVASRYQRNSYGDFKDQELKYRSSSHIVRRAILEEIANFRPDIRAVAVNKRNLQEDWKNYVGDKLYLKAIEELMDDVMKDIEGRVTVIMDPHAAIGKIKGIMKVEEKAARYSKELSRAIQDRKSVDEFALQTNDFVPGAIGDRYNLKRIGKFEIIEPYTELRKIEKKK